MGTVVAHADGGGATVRVTVTNTGAVDAHEVPQAYVAVPKVAGLITPRWSLAAFTRVLVAAGGSLEVELAVLPTQLTTVRADGTRTLTGGTYTFFVGGAQPGDPHAQSNVLNATLVF